VGYTLSGVADDGGMAGGRLFPLVEKAKRAFFGEKALLH